ncbi:unnamed protein product [Urochloa decumbens]|uniref:Uncharacterized protein n=1 Tax=Urochloa decumbens TaxID=240449 RepID=A0ABC8VXI7_9POAL
MAAAATLARVLRGGRRSGAGFNLLLPLTPGIGRRAPLERAAGPLLPRLGAAGGVGVTGRRMLSQGLWGSMIRKVPEGPPHHSPELLIRHLNERLNTIESYAASCRRHCFVALMTLVAGGMMVSPLLLDYIRLQRLEGKVRKLRASVAEAKKKSRNVDIALHGT